MIFIQFQILAQYGNSFFVHISGKFQTDRSQFFPLFDHFHHKITIIQIFVIQCVCVNICISCDAQQRFGFDLIPFEYNRCKMKDQFFS